jgi:hypothetical protein
LLHFSDERGALPLPDFISFRCIQLSSERRKRAAMFTLDSRRWKRALRSTHGELRHTYEFESGELARAMSGSQPHKRSREQAADEAVSMCAPFDVERCGRVGRG